MILSKPLGMTFNYLFFGFFRYAFYLGFKTCSLQKRILFLNEAPSLKLSPCKNSEHLKTDIL